MFLSISLGLLLGNPFMTDVSASTTAATSAPAAAAATAALDGRQIMDKVAVTRKLDGSQAVVTMTIFNDKGEKRERKIAMATKLYDGGKTEKRLYRFLSPEDVKGTGVLVSDYESKSDDTWIYLPALRKTRRIVAAQSSKSFMGSEFSYADLNIPSLDDFNYKVIKEEKVDGVDCWVIETLAKDNKISKKEGYSKKVYWVSKPDFSIRKAVYYDMKSKPIKQLTSKNIKLVDAKKKRYRSMYMEMKNLQNGRRSLFECEKVELAPKTEDKLFTTRYLERP